MRGSVLAILLTVTSLGVQSVGAGAATPEDAEIRDAVGYLNAARVAVGLAPMSYDPLLSAAARAHAEYLALNKDDPAVKGVNPKGVPNAHYEVRGLPGYTGDDDEARYRAAGGSGTSAGLISCSCGTYTSVVAGLLQVPLHRRWLLSHYTKVGFGRSTTDTQAQLAGPGRPTDHVVVWPYDGMSGVPINFGGEYPSPVPPGATDGGGYAITAQKDLDAVPITSAVLRAADGAVIDLLPALAVKGYEDFAPGIRIPASRLAYATRYTVTATVAGVQRTWSFTTRAAPPSRVMPSVRRTAGGILVSWSPPSSGTASGYHVLRGAPGNWERIADLPATAAFYLDGGPYPDPGPGGRLFWTAAPLDENGNEISGVALSPALGRIYLDPRPEWHAQWVRQSPYPVMAPGEVRQFWVEFVNLGSQPWVRGNWSTEAHLALNGDDQRPAQQWGMDPGTWLARDRLATHDQAVVRPGEVGRFSFAIRAPAAPGQYELNLRPVIDGVTWMEDNGVFWRITVTSPYHAKWIEQSAYPSVGLGEVATVFVRFQNTGSTTWTYGTATEVRLGVKGDALSFDRLGMAVGWPLPARPAIQAEPSVGPGASATFTFKVRGVAPGTYPLYLRPVIDGLAWLEDEGVTLYVTVR